MTIYVDKITMDFNTVVKGSVLDAKTGRIQCISKDIIIVKRGRYLMQYRTTVTCCECLDGMKKYNDKRKSELKP